MPLLLFAAVMGILSLLFTTLLLSLVLWPFRLLTNLLRPGPRSRGDDPAFERSTDEAAGPAPRGGAPNSGEIAPQAWDAAEVEDAKFEEVS